MAALTPLHQNRNGHQDVTRTTRRKAWVVAHCGMQRVAAAQSVIKAGEKPIEFGLLLIQSSNDGFMKLRGLNPVVP